MDNNFNNENDVKNVDYSMGTVENKPNILLGTLGALAAAIIGAVLWILISKTGYIFGILGAGIVVLAMFLYEKLAKGINLVGIIICIALTFAAIYIGNRIGAVILIQDEFSAYGEVTFSKANKFFKTFMDSDSEFSGAYYQDLIMSYIYSIVCSVVIVVSRIKKRK